MASSTDEARDLLNHSRTLAQVLGAIAAAANPPPGQALGLGTGTSMVQVSAGGNDLGFADDLSCAFTIGAGASNSTRTRRANGTFCIPDDATLLQQARTVNLQANLVDLYTQIANAAPNATVAVAGYPLIFPIDARKCTTGITKADEIQPGIQQRSRAH